MALLLSARAAGPPRPPARWTPTVGAEVLAPIGTVNDSDQAAVDARWATARIERPGDPLEVRWKGSVAADPYKSGMEDKIPASRVVPLPSLTDPPAKVGDIVWVSDPMLRRWNYAWVAKVDGATITAWGIDAKYVTLTRDRYVLTGR